MFELRLLSPGDKVDVVCDALESLDALSVSVEDADAQTCVEQPLYGEPGMPAQQESWQRSLLVALFVQELQAHEAAELLRRLNWALEILDIQAVPQQDWVRLTQTQFAPVEITPSFWIVPSWHEVPAQAQQVIRLDPGQAFGTGTHPTTRMCLRWLAKYQPHGRVLDYGCGSGILAIGAAKFGAVTIDAVDIDPAAVESTRLNALNNHVDLRAGLPDLLGQAQANYSLVMANILATPLKVLAPLLCGHVDKGGYLVLSGILQRQAQELQEAYAPYLALEVADSEDGWILMVAQRTT